MRKVAWAVAVMFVSLVGAGPATGQSDELIVPGVRIGPVRIGMHEADVYRVLGEPTRSRRFSDSTDYLWKDADTIMFIVLIGKSDHTVHRISTEHQKFATTDGLSVGASELRMRSVMGSPSREESEENAGNWYYAHFYHTQGVCFLSGSWIGNRIYRIAVFKPNPNMNNCS